MDAVDTYYPDGQSVTSLEPAVGRAEITNVMTPVMITNPAFEAGTLAGFSATRQFKIYP
jgi:hypothetical protein